MTAPTMPTQTAVEATTQNASAARRDMWLRRRAPADMGSPVAIGLSVMLPPYPCEESDASKTIPQHANHAAGEADLQSFRNEVATFMHFFGDMVFCKTTESQ